MTGAAQRVTDQHLSKLAIAIPLGNDAVDVVNLAKDLLDARATIAGLREEIERLKAEITNLGESMRAYARDARLQDERATRAEAALARLTQPDEAMARDAARYRMLRGGGDFNNRWPHVAQYLYQPSIDTEKVPQLFEHLRYCPEHLDAAVDEMIKRTALVARPAPETSATRGETNV